ncbi:MAG: hypothetical protein IT384_33745 [Deltaproteobacteria bacterium]|nr:hypothetical protein [Deltaproteobacteria bacterium]
MSSRFGKAGSPAGGGHHRGGVWSSRWATAIALSGLLAACSFQAPSVPSDGGTNPDGGLPRDGGTDADTGSSDVASVDGTLADSGGPDALSPPPDAGAGDAAPDAGPLDAAPLDAGAEDAGTPDALPAADALPAPDAGCGAPWSLTSRDPASAGTVPLPFTPDLPPLIVDADDDGLEEIVVASTNDRMVAVLDYEACRPGVITATLTQVPVDRAGVAAVLSGGRTHLVVAYQSEVALLRYDRAPTPTLGFVSRPTLPQTDIVGLAVDATGSVILADGAGPSSGITHLLTSAGGRTPTTLSQAVIGEPAFLRESGGRYDFLIPGDLSLILNTPGAGAGAIDIDDGNAQPDTAPVTLRPGALGNTSHAFAAYGSTNNGNSATELSVIRFDLTAGTQTRFGAPASARVVGGPLVITFGPATAPSGAGFYFTTDDDTLAGCALTSPAAAGWSCSSAGIPSFALGNGGASARISPLTAYVGQDALPDVVIATAGGTGRVHFRDNALSTAAAPSVTLAGSVRATPAISVRFFDRYRTSGNLMVVPIDGNRVALVVWPARATAGPIEHLWLQHRADQWHTARR